MFFLILAACQGPDAPDSAVCRDFIHRVCIAPVCPAVVSLFPAGVSCEATLQTTSGCINEDFAFTTPTRDRFLSCRLVLLRGDEGAQAHPDCQQLSDAFGHCADVVRMIQGFK